MICFKHVTIASAGKPLHGGRSCRGVELHLLFSQPHTHFIAPLGAVGSINLQYLVLRIMVRAE